MKKREKINKKNKEERKICTRLFYLQGEKKNVINFL
jgi:hypothetical protein